MTAFTIFGILSYWFVMGVIGYGLGYTARLALDMRQGIERLTGEADQSIAEVRVLIEWLTLHGKVAA